MDRELLNNPLSSRLAKGPRHLRVLRQPRDRVSDRIRISRFHKKTRPSILDQFGISTDTSGHDRKACSHRLQNHIRQTFRQGRVDHHIDFAQDLADVPALTGEDDTVAQIQFPRQMFHFRPVVPFG